MLLLCTVQDVLVCKRATIARRYLSTWFVPDVLGTVPIATLMGLFITTVGSNSLQSVKLIRYVVVVVDTVEAAVIGIGDGCGFAVAAAADQSVAVVVAYQINPWVSG